MLLTVLLLLMPIVLAVTAPPDEASKLALQLASVTVAGLLVQKFVRANPNVKTWWTYPIVGLAAVGLYVWSDYDAIARAKADWRMAGMSLYAFYLQIRGGASTSSDTKAAGATVSPK